jgi:hypothetical protein
MTRIELPAHLQNHDILFTDWDDKQTSVRIKGRPTILDGGLLQYEPVETDAPAGTKVYVMLANFRSFAIVPVSGD